MNTDELCVMQVTEAEFDNCCPFCGQEVELDKPTCAAPSCVEDWANMCEELADMCEELEE